VHHSGKSGAEKRLDRRGTLYTADIAMTKALLLPITAAGLMALLVGCSEASAPKAEAKEYKATGEILALDPAAQTAKIKADKIDGWMEAMTMDFPVKDKQEFEKLKVGETIQGKVTVRGTDYWLSGIAEAAPSSPPASK
jgi:Cu/Ag efflux protein CusF